MRAGPASLRFLTRLRRFEMTYLISGLPECKSFVESIGRGANPPDDKHLISVLILCCSGCDMLWRVAVSIKIM